jgi:hypothetical protein
MKALAKAVGKFLLAILEFFGYLILLMFCGIFAFAAINEESSWPPHGPGTAE